MNNDNSVQTSSVSTAPFDRHDPDVGARDIDETAVIPAIVGPAADAALDTPPIGALPTGELPTDASPIDGSPIDGSPIDGSPIDVDALDPFTDDLSGELDAAATKTWRNRATAWLACAALLVAGFLGGVLTQKHFGTPATAASGRGAGGAGAFGGGFARGGGAGGGRGAGPAGGTNLGGANGTGNAASAPQTGVIKLVDGTTIYVQMPDGDVLTVRTNGTTKVSLAATAKVSSLKKGQQVTFTGSTDATNQTVTATSVTASPASAK